MPIIRWGLKASQRFLTYHTMQGQILLMNSNIFYYSHAVLTFLNILCDIKCHLHSLLIALVEFTKMRIRRVCLSSDLCPGAEAGLADGPGDGEVAGDDGAAVQPHRRPAARDRDDRVPGMTLK